LRWLSRDLRRGGGRRKRYRQLAFVWEVIILSEHPEAFIMTPLSHLVPTAEAAFIAELTDRQMNRVVDEHLVPDVLFGQQGSTRLFTRLCAAFANFYFDTEDLLIAAARRQVLDELTLRVENLRTREAVFALHVLPENMNWKVDRFAVEIDVAPYISKAIARAKEVDQADALVTSDPEIMGGAPVFAGSRVPVDIVLASAVAGADMNQLRAAYSFLTSAHLTAARVYTEVHPRRGRPRRLSQANPDWKLLSSRVLRPAQV
jgi:uncharacterized protein (DUF433 family)